LKNLIEDIGLQRVSALPTISNFEKIVEIINGYKSIGLNEIFLRPVNHQGFARKKHKDITNDIDNWIKSYSRAIDHIIEHNSKEENKIIETNLALHLKRIFQAGNNGHVDLRSPNPAAQDYLVIDFDGAFYPTDEARMLTRIGMIDLRIGSLSEGLDIPKIESLDLAQDNKDDPICKKCAFQPFCGVDAIDKISRYSTVNHPTNETYFCKFHMAIFTKIFNLFETGDIKFLKTASLHLGGDYEINPALANFNYD
jgi:radical SAM protein with 4Fe4S-binding SPASM domain